MTGIILYPLASAAVGAACAAAGVYAVPPVPERAEMDRALLRMGLATVAACAWALCSDEVAATLAPFIAATFLLGHLRERGADRAAGATAAAATAAAATAAASQPSSSPSSSSAARGSSR